MHGQGKLKFYKIIKERLGFESYLAIDNFKHRRAITKPRASAHKFLIEIKHCLRKTSPLYCKSAVNEIGYLTDSKIEKIK